MRGMEILLVTLLGAAVGCKSATEPTSNREAANQPATSAEPDREAKPSASDEVEVAPEPEPPIALDDPQRADKLADLDDMCKAVDHDYVDGTLSDYYRNIQPRTDWGKAQRDAGNESIQPGRLLEKAVAELSPGAKDPALEHCRKLLDYLDDVE